MHTLNNKTFLFAACLSALAGYVDAVGFLHLGGYFISFMSGNSTRLAINIAEGNAADIIMLAGILSFFILGTMSGVFIHHFSQRDRASVNVLLYVATLLFIASLTHEMAWGFVPILCMLVAMGAENAILQRNGEVVVGLTYMTGTLVKIGQRLAGAVLGGPQLAWVPYLLLWLGLIWGGITGAVMFQYFGL